MEQYRDDLDGGGGEVLRCARAAGASAGLATVCAVALAVGCGSGRSALETGAGAEHEGASERSVGGAGALLTDGGSTAIDMQGGNVGGGATGGGTSVGGGVQLPPGNGPLLQRLDDEPLYASYVRLTHQQWTNSVRDNLRLSTLPRDVPTLGPPSTFARYPNDEAILYVPPQLVTEYSDVAAAIADGLRADADALARVYGGTDVDGLILEVGRRFYRRPLTGEETDSYRAVYDVGASFPGDSGAFAAGASLVIEALLQAPNFVYRIENAAEGQTLGGYELATKLSYFLVDTTPDEELLLAAEAGELDVLEGVATHAARLLQRQEAIDAMRIFHGATYRLDRVQSVVNAAVPDIDVLREEMSLASYGFFDWIFTSNGGLRDILLSEEGIVTARLAELYGIDPPSDGVPALLPLGVGRVGFFTQAPFLVIHGYGEAPASVRRGIEINSDVLCADLPLPAALPPPELPHDVAGTNRDRVTAVTSQPGCSGCHVPYIDPLGFAFEAFDGLGRARETDNGLPVDATGSYPFQEGLAEFDGAAELMQILAESQQAHECYAAHVVRYGLARGLTEGDRDVVDRLREVSQGGGAAASTRALMLELVTSDAFRVRRGAAP